MNQICVECGFEAPKLDENEICSVCSNVPIDALDEEDLLYVTRNTEQIYEAGGTIP